MLDLIFHVSLALASASSLQLRRDPPAARPSAAQVGDGVAPEPTPELSATQLEAEARRSEAWLNDPASRGLFVSATIAPAAARLLVTWRNGATEQRKECSGVLVGPSRILTAAHCVCGQEGDEGWYAPDAPSCRAQLGRLRVEILFSGVGAYRSAGAPRVAPQYRSSGQGTSGEVPVADLATIDLAASPPIAPARIALLAPSPRHLLVSYGVMTLASTPPRSVWQVGIPYQSGIKQVSVQPAIRTNPTHCGSAASQDTVCSTYDGLVVREGPDMDAGVCGGDSGAPLLQAAADGSLQVVGIASYFYPPAFACDASAGRHSHFVAVGRYAEWIGSAPSEPPPAASLACGEKIVIGPVRFGLKTSGRSYLTVSAFDLNGRERPSVTIANAGAGICRENPRVGYAACILPAGATPVVTLSGGMVQVALCRER